MQDRILEFLSTRPAENGPSTIDVDTDLFETGILDSFGFVELIGFLETLTGRTISDEDMEDPRFTTVAGIVEVLAAHDRPAMRAAAGGAR
jgi:acyl carrier protein